MGCPRNGAMQGSVMVHHTLGRMCAAEGLHYGAAWRHGTAQGLQEHKSRAARARHEVTIESLTYKFIMSEVLTEFPAAVQALRNDKRRIGGPWARARSAARSDKCPPTCTVAFRDVSRWADGRNPRRVASDPLHDRKSASRRPEKHKRAGFLRALQEAAVPGVGRVRTRPRAS